MQRLNLEHLTQFLLEGGLSNFNGRYFKESTSGELYSSVQLPNSPIAIAVFGSAYESDKAPVNINENQAVGLARAMAKYDELVILTGACPDNSESTKIAYYTKNFNQNVFIIGVSPFGSFTEMDRFNPGKYSLVKQVHDLIIYTDFGDFLMRDPINNLLCDGAISKRGSAGTNHEIAGMFDGPKVIGLLKGSGGVSDAQTESIQAIAEDGKDDFVVFHETLPSELVAKVMGQVYIDKAIKNGSESSAVDFYWKLMDDIEPTLQLRRFRRRFSGKLSQEPDRKYPFFQYNTDDIEPFGKILLGMPKSEIREYLESNYSRELKVEPERANFPGNFYHSATKDMHPIMLNISQDIMKEFGSCTYYHSINPC